MLLTLGEVLDEEGFCTDTNLYGVLGQPYFGKILVWLTSFYVTKKAKRKDAYIQKKMNCGAVVINVS